MLIVSLGVTMHYTANGVAAGESDQSGVSIPGLIAAGVWAIGLVVGLIALATGHAAVAGVSLVLAVMSPWFGLAWVSHSQRRVAHEAVSVGSFSSSWHGLRFTAR
ncbi:hypothetical protein H7I94_31530 [Mycobacterium szulgai]|nr:hypothetical protein [Mycobacterium szulgai]